MAKFVFKMQQLLNIKEQLEESIKNDLASAIRDLEEEKDKLHSLEEDKTFYMDNMREDMKKGVNVQKMREYNLFMDSLENKIKNQKIAINEAETVVDKIRERLIQIVKEKKMLETLKEKQREQFKIEQQKKEELALGEITSYKYIEHKAGENNGNR